MIHYFTNLITEVDDQLQFINAEYVVIQKRAEESYAVTSKAYEHLQALILKYKFKNQSEEIRYFKSQKPKLIVKLIYFSKVYHIEMKRHLGLKKSKNTS